MRNNTYTGTSAGTSASAVVYIPESSYPLALYGNLYGESLTFTYDVSVLMPETRGNINATLSFWGSDSEDIMETRIYDNTELKTVALVIYFPYLLSANRYVVMLGVGEEVPCGFECFHTVVGS